jgi:hypothetical protein
MRPYTSPSDLSVRHTAELTPGDRGTLFELLDKLAS